jgi:flagellar M-ring protein FliF
MTAFFEQFIAAFKGLPTSKKITMTVVLTLVIAGFGMMFSWAQKIDYQVLFANLSPEGAGSIVIKLKEQRIPYELAGGGSTVLVPAEKVYELRLALAGEGLPVGGHVGFEIFDKTDFKATEFVQRLNYQRALQGELARTIGEFREVERARVLVVMPKDSLFVEDQRRPSASVLLKLRSMLPPDKVEGIVHLVASAVEGLTPEQVTVVDTSGKVLFKGPNQADQAALYTSNNLDYQRQLEAKIGGRVQSMLEGIVGKGKAIVRVSANIDFERIDYSEEKYDPDSSVVRSTQRRSESSEKGPSNAATAPVMTFEQNTGTGQESQAKFQKRDEVVNYEIDKVMRHVMRPSGTIERLSVAAAVDGTYEVTTAEDGTSTKNYVPRSQEELQEFEKIVKRAIGFDVDRGDQVYVSSFPLSISSFPKVAEHVGIDWVALGRQHLRTALNFVLVIMVFLFVVRPLLRSVKDIGTTVKSAKQLPGAQERPEGARLPEPEEMDMQERTMRLAKDNIEKTEHMLRGWLREEK